MPDDPAFIRTIAAAPHDDAPRLVYADVLEERGDEASAARAEFIRVQVERARLDPRTPRWNALWHRDTALLDWARRWREELPVVQGVTYGGFIRGFIDRVTVTLAASLPAGLEAVFDSVPVRVLELHEWFSHPPAVPSREGWISGVRPLRRPAAEGSASLPPLAPGTWSPARNADELSRTRQAFQQLLREKAPWITQG